MTALSEVRATPARTPAQHALYVVSVLMGALGAFLLVICVAELLSLATGGDDPLDAYAVVVFLLSGLLLMVTGVLGLRAADDSSKVGPYRALCYLVGLVILVAFLAAWGQGKVFSFVLNPLVVFDTVVYVVLCSRLADQVSREHERGVTGTPELLSGYQRALRLMSVAIVVLASLSVAAALVLYVWQGVSQASPELSGMDLTPVSEGRLVGVVVAAGLSLVTGVLGIRASSAGARTTAFVVVAGLSVAAEAASLAAGVLREGADGVDSGTVLALLYLLAALHLARRVREGGASVLAAPDETRVAAPVVAPEEPVAAPEIPVAAPEIPVAAPEVVPAVPAVPEVVPAAPVVPEASVASQAPEVPQAPEVGPWPGAAPRAEAPRAEAVPFPSPDDGLPREGLGDAGEEAARRAGDEAAGRAPRHMARP